jgi:hypothetical protein
VGGNWRLAMIAWLKRERLYRRGAENAEKNASSVFVRGDKETED